MNETPRLLRVKDVMRLTALSRATIYRDPSFPKPLKIGERASAWVEGEVRGWIATRIAARDTTRK